MYNISSSCPHGAQSSSLPDPNTSWLQENAERICQRKKWHKERVTEQQALLILDSIKDIPSFFEEPKQFEISTGQSLAEYAMQEGWLSVIKKIVEMNLMPVFCNEPYRGRSDNLCDAAIQENQVKIFEWLLKSGGVDEGERSELFTTLAMFYHFGDVDRDPILKMLEILLEAGVTKKAKTFLLTKAVIRQDVNLVKKLMGEEVDVNATIETTGSSLIEICRATNSSHSHEIAKILTKLGAVAPRLQDSHT